METRFSNPQTFPSGVRWEPTDYKPIDQTPYLDYLERTEGHRWKDGICHECEADASWCDNPPRSVREKNMA